MDMRAVLDKIAESLEGDISIEPDWLSEHVGVLPEDRVRIDPEVWAHVAGHIERREAMRAGKTRLVQAVSQALGVDPQDVVSPRFVLIHEYQGRLPIYHFDVYRLRDDDEFLQLGPNEYFENQGVTFVKWADRVRDRLPAERLEIRIEVTGQLPGSL